MKHKTVIIFAILIWLFAACGKTQVTDNGLRIKTEADPQVYTVVFKVEEGTSYSTTNMTASSYDGIASLRMWDGGKGLLRGKVLNIMPENEAIKTETQTVIKATDRKLMAVQPNDVILMACLVDWEPVCASNNTDRVSECIDTYELDFCRMIQVVTDEFKAVADE